MAKTRSDRAIEIVDEIDNDEILLIYVLEAYADRHNKNKMTFSRNKNGSTLTMKEKPKKVK